MFRGKLGSRARPMFNVILPTYNEADCIVTIINMLAKVFTDMRANYKIIVVDDNSPDHTSDIVKGLHRDEVEVIDRPAKMGLGSAYAAGLQGCIYPYTVIMDSDLQHDPFAIKEMVKKIKKRTDIVTGTRYAKGGKVCNQSFLRLLISCTANNLARFVLGLNTRDLTGSFRIYRTKLLEELIKEVECKRFGFQMEIMARAEKRGCNIVEVPITFHQRVAGESKISSKEIIHFAKAVGMLYMRLCAPSLAPLIL